MANFVASAPIITTANTVNNSNSTVATEINKSGNCSYVNGMVQWMHL